MTHDEARYPRLAPGLVLAAATLFAAACADEPIAPLDTHPDPVEADPSFAMQLTCAIDVAAGRMECGPSAPSTGAGSGSDAGPSMNLIVGGQHHFVRLANDAPVMEDDVWSANVTVQNLTLQPMGTRDGISASGYGVKVFFVDEPSHGVVVSNHTGEDVFRGSEPAKYFEYVGPGLGVNGILRSGRVSPSKRWEFELNGATEFVFSVLVATEVHDAGAYAVRMEGVSAGGQHSCAAGSDGKVYCWGTGANGYLGRGNTTSSSVPVRAVLEGVELANVQAGTNHSCAEGSDQELYCWGGGTHGVLGHGSTSNSSVPVAVDVSGLDAGVRLSNPTVGREHTCAEGSDDRIYCWGRNNTGQLGDGGSDDQSTPVPVASVPNVTLSNPSAGGFITCADGSDGDVYCWGANGEGTLGNGFPPGIGIHTPVQVLRPAADITLSNVSVGTHHACADGSDNNVYCWGTNHYGQLGDGSTQAHDTPTRVSAPAGVSLSHVSAGHEHTCAHDMDGNVYCWGRNQNGQLGADIPDEASTTPVKVAAPLDTRLSNVSAGTGHSCADGPDGVLYCWGNNGNGRLGDATTTTRPVPTVVAGTGGS